MMTEPKTAVTSSALKDLLMWCEDAIDFRDESDEWAAKAFDIPHGRTRRSSNHGSLNLIRASPAGTERAKRV